MGGEAGRRRGERRGVPRRLARVAGLAMTLTVVSLIAAAPAGAASVFSDGFESGDFSAWTQAQTSGDGTASVQGAIVSTGSLAAQLSETANPGSRAYLRKTLDASQPSLSASGDFRVLAQGASGGNVPFFRFLDPGTARVVSVYRQNGTAGKIGLTYGGSFFTTTGSLPLDTWGTISMRVVTNGAASTIEVRLNGSLIYRTTSASLGTAGVQTVQIGNDTAAQAFTLVADTIDVRTPPETTIDSGPPALTRDATPTFAFSSEPGASFQCRLDSGQEADWQPCSSPRSYGPLGDGSHTFEVRAIDVAHNVDPSPASTTFTIDTTPPSSTIRKGPGGITNDPTPTFSFSSSEPGSSFECKIDSGPFAPCGPSKTTPHLGDGSHTFRVRATDPAGNRGPADSRTFEVRTAAVSISGATLVIDAAPRAEDNLVIARGSPSTLRVTDLPDADHAGSGVHVGAGCTRRDSYTATCVAAITRIQVSARGRDDTVVDSTVFGASLYGGPGDDTLEGGPANDILVGGGGADVLRAMDGNDLILARDLATDKAIDCDGGGAPGGDDRAYLDPFPLDPNSRVRGCEDKTRG